MGGSAYQLSPTIYPNNQPSSLQQSYGLAFLGLQGVYSPKKTHGWLKV